MHVCRRARNGAIDIHAALQSFSNSLSLFMIYVVYVIDVTYVMYVVYVGTRHGASAWPRRAKSRAWRVPILM